MRTVDDLCAVLDSIGVEWFNEGVPGSVECEPPYICLSAGFGQAQYADNTAYIRWMPYEVLLYTAARDYALERALGDALDKADLPWSKAVTTYDSERLVESSFTVIVTEPDPEDTTNLKR